MLAAMRVVDISQQLPGPYTSALLRALGATVTKVEPASGDPSRRLDAAMYRMVNTGKEVIHLDLKTGDGVEALHRLVTDADVFIEGFRPGVAARLGASWETLSELNRALVYCSISAAGQDGPYSAVPMHDLNLQGIAGLDPGQGIGVPWVDLGTATSSALAIVAAWHAACETGTGARLDTAMLDTAVLWGRVKADAAGRTEPTYGTFATADGTRVAVAILEDHIWVRLCEALGWDDWRDEPSLRLYTDRVQHAAPIHDRLAKECLSLGVDRLIDLADLHDLPITPVGAVAGSDAFEQLRSRRLLPSSDRRLPLPEIGGESIKDREGVTQ